MCLIKQLKIANQELTMKKMLLILWLFFTPTLGHAALASSVESHYKTLNSWRANFIQTTFIEVLNDNIQKQGAISVLRPDKIHIEYTNPKKVYVSDGKKLWIYSDDATAWEFNRPKKIISEEALSFLSGLKELSTLFDVMEDLDETKGYFKINDTQLKKLFLIPKDKNADILKIALGIDAQNHVKEAVLFNVSGNISHYEFRDITPNAALDAQLFTLPDKKNRKIIKK